MRDPVSIKSEGEIAIITLTNPPVNELSPGVPEGLAASLETVSGDTSIRAAVLRGAGGVFSAGADIRQFGKQIAGTLPRLLLALEDSPKPWVAAIHGVAFGGGLELAMALHYRVATPGALLGQPEVKLGIIPGAAGTQRLPRLAGVAKAVEMCAFGEPVTAREALECGLLDRIIEGDLLSGAIQFAREILESIAEHGKTRDLTEKLGDGRTNDEIFSAARVRAQKARRGQTAPLAAIDAVEAATTSSFEEGSRFEEALFRKCFLSDQSRALIHIFLGEREAARIPDVPVGTPVMEIKSAGVVGAGTMGGGIAMVYANAGIPVLLKDASQELLDRGVGTIRRNYSRSVKRGRLSQEEMDRRMALITPALDYDGFSEVDIVVEAVFEGMALKKQIFSELNVISKPAAILASNTSTLNIDEIASATSRPEAVIGHHFFSPANVMRLLEIVRGKETSPEVIATSMSLARRLGKVAVLVGNCRGFVGNRMLAPYTREAQFLVEEGARPDEVDGALQEFGMAMGPLAMGDLAGLDVSWRIRKEYRHLEDPELRRPLVADRLCEMGRYGQKTGAGWYRYDEDRRAVHDPEVMTLIEQVAAEAGIRRREISRDEIVERTMYALVNEGARILEEGYALRAADMDIIYVNGYGYPAWRGGPMWYADAVGLKRVNERILDYQAVHGRLWRPAALLERLAREGRTFAEYDDSRGKHAG